MRSPGPLRAASLLVAVGLLASPGPLGPVAIAGAAAPSAPGGCDLLAPAIGDTGLCWSDWLLVDSLAAPATVTWVLGTDLRQTEGPEPDRDATPRALAVRLLAIGVSVGAVSPAVTAGLAAVGLAGPTLSGVALVVAAGLGVVGSLFVAWAAASPCVRRYGPGF